MKKDEKLKALVDGCKHGQVKSQQLLYQELASVLMGVCMRFSHKEVDAEDLLQEVFIKIFLSINTYKGEGSFEGWAKRIATNCAINQYRKNQKIKETMEMEPLDENMNISVEEEAETIPYEILLKMVQNLPDGYRTIFNLSAIEGYSHTEIAEMTGMTYTTIASQLCKAKKTLQTEVNKYLNKI
jgi:RNA polymerase sigma-70 factor (ECF subfamily)